MILTRKGTIFNVHNSRSRGASPSTCDSVCIRCSKGHTFQMNVFEFINSLFKCWIRFEYCFLKSVVHTELTKILVKGFSNFSNKLFWRKIDWYVIDHFSIFWEAQYFLVEINQFLFNLFWFLMLLFYEIYQFFFWLFKKLIICIKLGMEFSLKAVFNR